MGHCTARKAACSLGIVATVMHDVYDALTAALLSFMDRRPRFCRQVTGRLVGAHPRALGGAGGRARRRVVVLLARKYIICIHTRPTVAWGPPPGAVGSILMKLSYAVTRSSHRCELGREGVNVSRMLLFS